MPKVNLVFQILRRTAEFLLSTTAHKFEQMSNSEHSGYSSEENVTGKVTKRSRISVHHDRELAEFANSTAVDHHLVYF